MSFFYDWETGTIVDPDPKDGGLIADLVETVDPEDGMKMAAGPVLFDALAAIIYAWQIGKLDLPEPLSSAGLSAVMEATAPTAERPL